MSKNPVEYLRHIHDECKFIMNVSERLTSKDDLLADEIVKRAFARSLEIIGEASKKIPADFKIKWNAVNWKNMAGMRDRLIHEYMGINYSIVWDVIKNKIPELSDQIEQVIEQEETNQ